MYLLNLLKYPYFWNGNLLVTGNWLSVANIVLFVRTSSGETIVKRAAVDKIIFHKMVSFIFILPDSTIEYFDYQINH